MAQATAVATGVLPSTLSSTIDFTSSGIGTVDAAILIFSDANTTNNPQQGSLLGVGLWDGTNARACAFTQNDNQNPTDTSRYSNDAYGVGFNNPPTPTILAEYSVTSITDGIRLTMDTDATGVARYCHVLLIAGVDSSLITFTPNATQNNTTESASLGFAPEAIVFACIGATTADTNGAHAVLSLGVACSNGDHRWLCRGSVDNVNPSSGTLQYSETRCVGQAFGGTLAWSGEVTTWGADTFTMTTRDGASGGDVCFALALGGDASVECGTLTTPTSTGTDAVTTTFEPETVLLSLSLATSTTIETDADSNALCYGISDATDDYCVSIVDEDAASPSDTESNSQAAKCLDVDTVVGTDSIDATMDSFNATDFTLNYSAVNGTARKGFWIAFEKASAATGRTGSMIGSGGLVGPGGPIIGPGGIAG